MSYFRANGRFGGRICSGGKRACADVDGGYSLGADDFDIGSIAGGGSIQGNPITALYAQLNRFAGKPIKPASYATERYYVRTPYALSPMLTDQAATAAILILIDRYAYAPIGTYSATKHKWAQTALAGDAASFVSKNITEVVQTIAEFGDRMDLPPASVGITERGAAAPGLNLKTLGPVVVAGAALLVALFVTGRK